MKNKIIFFGVILGTVFFFLTILVGINLTKENKNLILTPPPPPKLDNKNLQKESSATQGNEIDSVNFSAVSNSLQSQAKVDLTRAKLNLSSKIGNILGVLYVKEDFAQNNLVVGIEKSKASEVISQIPKTQDNYNVKTEIKEIVCSKEVKICSNEIEVKRNPARNCDFDPCPNQNNQANEDSSSGFAILAGGQIFSSDANTKQGQSSEEQSFKTYRNENFRFELTYPAFLDFEENIVLGQPELLFANNKEYAEILAIRFCLNNCGNPGFVKKEDLANTKEGQIGNESAKIITYSGGTFFWYFANQQIQYDENDVPLFFEGYIEVHTAENKKNEELAKQILSTFKKI